MESNQFRNQKQNSEVFLTQDNVMSPSDSYQAANPIWKFFVGLTLSEFSKKLESNLKGFNGSLEQLRKIGKNVNQLSKDAADAIDHWRYGEFRQIPSKDAIYEIKAQIKGMGQLVLNHTSARWEWNNSPNEAEKAKNFARVQYTGGKIASTFQAIADVIDRQLPYMTGKDTYETVKAYRDIFWDKAKLYWTYPQTPFKKFDIPAWLISSSELPLNTSNNPTIKPLDNNDVRELASLSLASGNSPFETAELLLHTFSDLEDDEISGFVVDAIEEQQQTIQLEEQITSEGYEPLA